MVFTGGEPTTRIPKHRPTPVARFEVRTLFSPSTSRIYVKHTSSLHHQAAALPDATYDSAARAYVLPAKSSCAAALLRAYDGLAVEYYAAFATLCPTSSN